MRDRELSSADFQALYERLRWPAARPTILSLVRGI
jgi:hypothetical protein